MRDGRVGYIGAERVDDVTAHPAFRRGAEAIAALEPRRLTLPLAGYLAGSTAIRTGRMVQ